MCLDAASQTVIKTPHDDDKCRRVQVERTIYERFEQRGGHRGLLRYHGPYLTAGQSHLPHSFDLSPAPHAHPLHNAEHINDAVQTIPPTPMGPPTWSRKKKAPTLRANAWEPYKARIIELNITQKLPLRNVKEIIKEEFGSTAAVRQYRSRTTQWRKDKNIKPEEMRAIARKQQRRKLVEVINLLVCSKPSSIYALYR
ncbi:uncharacterized protein BDR25DRAFT_315650 [Lindgomyces ingoldianus]|uniref:Uncharacterized protein n=1 Tax=Lindgomyces ingoldianus TaxID=673940 RepID=A0ACB6QQE0_9PLEO|nr:uncharacterized protein BDR25DRAFT_315650 [Lindgomyces ingoldianus]KAF2469209.1 hypothetical protein BDR25DRAFT_315650 [Lindgomyces ingoldianus]